MPIELGRSFNPWKLFVGSMVPSWLMLRVELSPGAKLCYARLCQYAGKHGVAFPLQDDLAEALGVSSRQVKRYMRELVSIRVQGVACPLIRVARVHRRRANRVTFVLHPWMALDAPIDQISAQRGEGTDMSPLVGTDPSPPMEKEKRFTRENQKAGGAARRPRPRTSATSPPSHATGLNQNQERLQGMIGGVAAALQMPGATQPGIKPSEVASVRARIEQLSKGERAKLERFARWLQGEGADLRLTQAVVSDYLARGDVENPYAYYAAGSAARERLRRATA